MSAGSPIASSLILLSSRQLWHHGIRQQVICQSSAVTMDAYSAFCGTCVSKRLGEEMSALIPDLEMLPDGCVSSEELHQHRCECLRSNLVRLTFQGAVLGMGHRICKRQ